jgi:hypothetical protein
MERAGGGPAALESLSAEQLDALWNQVKTTEEKSTEHATAEEQH